MDALRSRSGTQPASAVPASGQAEHGPLEHSRLEHGQLGQTLANCAQLRASGVLRVTGEPGGAVHLADGRITAITTPGAPDPEVILLRSGRVPEAGWSAVFAAAAADGRMGVELVKRDLIGAGELEALLRTALADAMFAVVAGLVEDCKLEEATVSSLLPLDPPAEVGWLLAEARRRIEVLESLASPIAHDRDRVTTVQGKWTPRVGPGDGHAEIIALANGRRSARDMAFVLGRGVYSVALQLSRMCDAGLLVIDSSRPASRPRPAPAQSGKTDQPSGNGTTPPPLPRRRRGAGLVGARQQEKSSVLRMLRPGSGTSRQPGRQTP
jgi:hypothetical protein